MQLNYNYTNTHAEKDKCAHTDTRKHNSYHKQQYFMHVYKISKNTLGVKKGEAKSEAPKIILFIYSTKKIYIMQVEAKACITDRIM